MIPTANIAFRNPGPKIPTIAIAKINGGNDCTASVTRMIVKSMNPPK